MKRQRAEVTAKYEAAQHQEVVLPVLCFCRSFMFSHTPEAHRQLRSDHDYRTPVERAGSEIFEERFS